MSLSVCPLRLIILQFVHSVIPCLPKANINLVCCMLQIVTELVDDTSHGVECTRVHSNKLQVHHKVADVGVQAAACLLLHCGVVHGNFYDVEVCGDTERRRVLGRDLHSKWVDGISPTNVARVVQTQPIQLRH